MSQATRLRVTRPLRRRLDPSALALALVFFGGCRRAGAPPPAPGDLAAPPRIEIENLNRLDIVIYQVADGRTLRLGRAPAFETKTFDLRVSGVTMTDVRFIAEPTGAKAGFTSAHTSERVSVRRGDLVVWRLESGLERSAIEVRGPVIEESP